MNPARRLTTLAWVPVLVLSCWVDAGADTAAKPSAGSEAEKLLGDWSLSYTTKDANRNRVLDESERKTVDAAAGNSATAFLHFEKGGKVEMDRKLRFKGRYENVAQDSHDELVLAFDDKDIGTYRMLVIRITDKELVLEPSIGTFNVYRRL